MAPIAAAPILPTAIPPAIHASPTASPAAMYLTTDVSDAASATSASEAKTPATLKLPKKLWHR